MPSFDTPRPTAHSLADHRAQTVRWLQGELPESINYHGGPDEETGPLVPVLVELNERGFWTDFSQPGQVDGEYTQRACVGGYCTEEMANHVIAAAAPTDLIVLAIPACLESYAQIVISRTGQEEHTWGGGHDPEDVARFLSPTVVQEFLSLWWVQAIDPVCGRQELLWDCLLDAVRRPQLRILDSSWPGVVPPGATLGKD